MLLILFKYYVILYLINFHIFPFLIVSMIWLVCIYLTYFRIINKRVKWAHFSMESAVMGRCWLRSSLFLMMSSMRWTSLEVHLLWLMTLMLSREGEPLPTIGETSWAATLKAATAMQDKCLGWACWKISSIWFKIQEEN